MTFKKKKLYELGEIMKGISLWENWQNKNKGFRIEKINMILYELQKAGLSTHYDKIKVF